LLERIGCPSVGSTVSWHGVALSDVTVSGSLLSMVGVSPTADWNGGFVGETLHSQQAIVESLR